MRRLLLGCLVFIAAPALAQQAPRAQEEALRQQVMERFLQNYRNQAGLTDEQFQQFTDIALRSFRERRQLEMQQRQLMRALEGQLRPGVAADQDSLIVLLEGMTQNRQTLVDMGRRDLEEYATFLDPVQQAQLILSLERFQQQIENLIRRRAQQRRQGNLTEPS